MNSLNFELNSLAFSLYGEWQIFPLAVQTIICKTKDSVRPSCSRFELYLDHQKIVNHEL